MRSRKHRDLIKEAKSIYSFKSLLKIHILKIACRDFFGALLLYFYFLLFIYFCEAHWVLEMRCTRLIYWGSRHPLLFYIFLFLLFSCHGSLRQPIERHGQKLWNLAHWFWTGPLSGTDNWKYKLCKLWPPLKIVCNYSTQQICGC